MPKEVIVNVTEVTIVTGKKKTIRVNIGGVNVNIPVDEEVHAYLKSNSCDRIPHRYSVGNSQL